MKNNNIRYQLRNNKNFNPFSDAFNNRSIVTEVSKYLKDKSEQGDIAWDKDDITGLSILSNISTFHRYFLELYDYMKQQINDADVSAEALLKYFIAFANHDATQINKIFRRAKDEEEEYSIEKAASILIKESDSNASMGAADAFEVQVDILNLLINYIRYFLDKDIKRDSYDPKYLHDICTKMYKVSNMLYLIKDAFDTVLWENGTIEERADTLFLTYNEANYPILKQIGVLRIQRNTLAAVLNLQQFIFEYPQLKRFFIAKNKGAVIKDLHINNRGFVSLELTKVVIDEIEMDELINGAAFITSFYPHVYQERLVNNCNLTVFDLMALHEKVTLLAKKIQNVLNQQNGSIEKYNIRIKKKEIVRYLQQTTYYTEKEIESYLKLNESELTGKERINLWSAPLIKVREVYYIALPAVLHPNYLQLLDEWLDKANYSLEKRGEAFENFIKDELSRILLNKGQFTIPKTNKYAVSKKIFEEIDLVISFDEFIIIGEIKNVKYPMEARNYHNALKRVQEGAQQVLRKKEFLMSNKAGFSGLLKGIEGKEVYCMVICNYPHFTGMEFMGVPIIDYMALYTYMSDGEITNHKASFDQINNRVISQEIEKKRLWMNRREFFENFDNYIRNPTIVDELKRYISIESKRITITNVKPEIYMQYANIIIDKRN